MIALSIRQPWAWAILHAGKDIENRKWTTTFRGPLLIHAAKTLYDTSQERDRTRAWVWRRFHVKVPLDDDLPRGGIVGKANVVDVVER
jgi:hypothetical protein